MALPLTKNPASIISNIVQKISKAAKRDRVPIHSISRTFMAFSPHSVALFGGIQNSLGIEPKLLPFDVMLQQRCPDGEGNAVKNLLVRFRPIQVHPLADPPTDLQGDHGDDDLVIIWFERTAS